MGRGSKERGKTQFFGGEVQSPPQSLPELQILIPHKKHPDECAWSDYCNDFENSERVLSFKATNLRHVRLQMEKRWQNL